MNWIHVTQIEEDTVVVNMAVSSSHSMAPLEAAVYTVHEIVQSYPPPYTLMLSGGIDSQAMAYAWKQSGVEFQSVSVKYNNDMNSHDLESLTEFSQLHDIPIQYINFDLLTFLSDEYDHWASSYNCASPCICAYMKMSEEIKDGTVIFSGNFLSNTSTTQHILDYTILGLYRYAKQSTKSVVPFFFIETPELAYSFLPYTELVGGDGYDFKSNMYRLAGFPIIPQPQKYSGFEKVKDYYDLHYSHLQSVKDKLQFAGKRSKRTFDQLLRYPYERKLGVPTLRFIISNENN